MLPTRLLHQEYASRSSFGSGVLAGGSGHVCAMGSLGQKIAVLQIQNEYFHTVAVSGRPGLVFNGLQWSESMPSTAAL